MAQQPAAADAVHAGGLDSEPDPEMHALSRDVPLASEQAPPTPPHALQRRLRAMIAAADRNLEELIAQSDSFDGPCAATAFP